MGDMYRTESENLRKAFDGDEEAATALFKKGAPKFVEPSLLFATFDETQTKEELAADIASRAKLADLLGKDEEELKTHLHAHKRRTNQLVWTSGQEPLAGTRKCADTLDFYIDGDTIYVASVTVSQGHGEKLLQATKKLLQDPRKDAKRFTRN